jgi:hypothetical protein
MVLMKKLAPIGVAAALGGLFMASYSANAIMNKYQSCSGTLISTEEGYKLKPDAGSGLWCDAIINSGEYRCGRVRDWTFRACE